MAEKLEVVEDGAEYYMVTVSESVTFSYPVLATDMEAAREKVAALIEAGRVRAPLDLVGAPCRREGIEVVGAEKTPPQMAHAAKSILRKTGSGKLTPTKRQRK